MTEVIASITEFYVFVLAAFVGFQVISRVPSLLHTPLMSATNAISGISLVGSLVAAGSPGRTSLLVARGEGYGRKASGSLAGERGLAVT